jgi:hypothetical protein
MNQTNRSHSKRAIINAVIQLEKRVWKAAQDRDADTFKTACTLGRDHDLSIWSDTQPQYLASMSDRTISDYEPRHIRGFMPDPTTVILYYEALRLGKESGRSFLADAVSESTTWIKRESRWVAILNQQTPIAVERG